MGSVLSFNFKSMLLTLHDRCGWIKCISIAGYVMTRRRKVTNNRVEQSSSTLISYESVIRRETWEQQNWQWAFLSEWAMDRRHLAERRMRFFFAAVFWLAARSASRDQILALFVQSACSAGSIFRRLCNREIDTHTHTHARTHVDRLWTVKLSPQNVKLYLR